MNTLSKSTRRNDLTSSRLTKQPTKYSEARNLYDLSVSLSKTWLKKYYPKINYKFLGISIETIQTFSQHQFFSSLLESKQIDDFWSQYPKVTDNKKSIFFLRLAGFIKVINSVKNLFFLTRENLKIKDKYDVIILSSGRHLTDLRGLVKYLDRKFKILVVGKIFENDLKFLTKNNIAYINVRSGRSFLNVQQRLKNLWTFLSSWNKKSKNKLLSSSPWYLRLTYLKFEQFPEIIALLTLAKSIFDKTQPKIVLTSSSNDTFGGTFTLMAKKTQVPVAEIQHGFISWKIGYEFSHANHMLVWGKVPKNLYKQYAHNVEIVGCPFFEKPKVQNVSLQLKNNNIIKILILWSPPSGYISLFQQKPNAQSLKNLVSSLTKLGDKYVFTIRSHPSYPVTDDLSGFEIPKNFSLSSESNLWKDINSHDLIITGPTTAGFASMLWSKPMLYFDNSSLSQKFGHPFINSKSALKIPLNKIGESYKYIAKLIVNERLLENQRKYQQKFIGDYCSFWSEDSSEVIAKFIKRVIGQNTLNK